MHFVVSGVVCPIWLPPVVAFLIALATTPAGVSGAFLLLPVQMSVLGFVGPAVTPTNLLYNVVAVPGGVVRYIRERRMVWPLAWIIAAGTLPGVFLGAIIRIHYLPNPRYAKVFVGCVLLYLGARLLLRRDATPSRRRFIGVGRRIKFQCQGDSYTFSSTTLTAVSLAVGVVGGIYGIGGGAMIAPFLMTILGLPACAVAGAALFGTLVTSVAGVAVFASASVWPDWTLGLLFGFGGLAGSYCGARLQKRLPERLIRLFLGCLVTGLGMNYIAQFFIQGSRS
jgi:uncharacterized protein